MIPNSSEEYSQCDATQIAIQTLKTNNRDVLRPKHVHTWQEHSSSRPSASKFWFSEAATCLQHDDAARSHHKNKKKSRIKVRALDL